MSNPSQNAVEQSNKRVVYIDNLYRAMLSNQLELDKQLLTLSTLAIGLLVGVFGTPQSTLEFVLWIVASALFIFCIVLLLLIFERNSTYVQLLQEEHDSAGDRKAALANQITNTENITRRIMTLVYFSFGSGATLTVVLAVIESGFIIAKPA